MKVDVSIIMGIYNCEKTLSDTIDSIINQTYKNWELIMCDDGSSDATYRIAKEYSNKDNRIKVIKNSENLRLPKTLNNCLEHAMGEYIMRHDGDDIMVSNRIEKQLKYMKISNCDVCGAGAYIFDDSGVWGLRQPEKYPSSKSMVLGAPFIHPTVIMKKSTLLQVDGYSDNELTRKRLEDYDLWLKLLEKNFVFQNIQEPLIYFRENKNSYNRKKKKFRMAETKARLIACSRLKIPYLQRIFALKPLVVMMIPKKILRKYHIRKASFSISK
ncbi:glycosyltransferase family 2 protein [Senegalia massiliensis]|uniref:Glycosyltransferase n=1 Tax=Senegalia massiliensis TaxID=1720316 RepID=A0A845R0N2_9CLOT|nr:glycosyltransferase family 2 protein [Senegalia massiliensis]NBI07990.1 glycosyltransferase [Senegalia massiliensis]